MKIAEGIYAYIWRDYRQNNCNSFVIETETTTLVDPGHAHLLEGLLAGVREDGLDPESIDLVINTHCHPDHLEGSRYFAEQGARLAIHPEEEKYLKEIGPAFYRMMGLEMPEFSFDVQLDEGDLELGGERFEVIHTPGHSPGEVCVYWPARKAIFSGDVVFAGSVGRTDFPGGDGSLLKQSITRLAGYDAEILLPGHMEIVVGADEVQGNFRQIQSLFAYL